MASARWACSDCSAWAAIRRPGRCCASCGQPWCVLAASDSKARSRLDETYVGGIEQGTRGRGTERKFIVAIAIEVLSPIGFGRVRLKRVADASSRSLTPFAQFAIEPGSQVRTDGWKGYAGLAKEGYEHHV